MNILILVSTLTHGGAERVASLWANGFANSGHNVSVCTCKGKNIPDSYSLDSKVQRYDIYNCLFTKLLRYEIHFPMVLRLRKIIKKVKPDVIICVLDYWHKWAFCATKGMNIPIINTDHNSWERPEYAPMLKKTWKRKFVDDKRYAAVTVLTDADKKCIRDTLKNVFVLPNPLTYSPVKTIPPKDKIILAVGRFNDWHYKGFDLLIKAWGKIASANSDWKLYIAGTGNTESINFLKQLVKENKVSDSIVFPGFVEMLPLYQKASIFVLSSRYEGFGMVLTEAMSQGCACIACDYKGRQSEIITSENEGITIPIDDIDAIATAINKLTHDDVLRRKLQLGGIERSHFFSIDNTMVRWNKILSSVVKQ
jgi:glycosyltransferase involved in cell wall biosynthesis